MANIKDVAARAGVSYSTVSYVLNDTRRVLPATRERVLAAARALAYVPSAVAQSLKQNATHTIGLIVPNSTNPYWAELARGIEDACFRSGQTLILCNSDEEPARQEAYVRLLRHKRVDGMIVASLSGDARWTAALSQVQCPVVVTDRRIPGLPADLVQADNRRAGELAAGHLLLLGHRRVGCLAGPADLGVVRERLGGFRQRLERGGVDLPASAVANGAFTVAEGHRMALELLRTRRRPTAVFALNDLMAIGALRAVAELGLRAPDDVSVVGFDDVELARYVFPALTTVSIGIRRLGEATVEALLRRAHHPDDPPRCITLPPRLVERESSGPPRPPARARRAAGKPV